MTAAVPEPVRERIAALDDRATVVFGLALGLARLMAQLFLYASLIVALSMVVEGVSAGRVPALAAAGVLVMLGAVSFHTLTPLGIDPNNDGGGLFVAACVNLAFGLALLGVFRRREFGELIGRVLAIFAPSRA